jgi:hypothetical protein
MQTCSKYGSRFLAYESLICGLGEVLVTSWYKILKSSTQEALWWNLQIISLLSNISTTLVIDGR